MLWLVLVLFLIHDVEEILTVAKWMAAHKDEIAQRFGHLRLVRSALGMMEMSTAQFALTVALIQAFSLWACATYRTDPIPFVIITAVRFVNSFTHVGQSLLLRRYTPGVVTAVVLLIPTCLYVFQRAFAEGATTPGQMLLWALCAIPVFALLPFLHQVSRRILRVSRRAER